MVLFVVFVDVIVTGNSGWYYSLYLLMLMSQVILVGKIVSFG